MTCANRRAVCVVVVTSAVLTVSCGPAPTRPSSLAWIEHGQRESVRVEPGALERKARIVAELGEPDLPRWAGHYAWNNGGECAEGYSCEEFWLAPRSGIAWSKGDLHKSWNHGDIVADGGDHVVVHWASDPALSNVPDASDSRFITRLNLSDRIDFVPWADALLIVPRVRMIDVVNSINGGFAGEYSTRKAPAIYTPAYEVDAREFAGAMQLPAEFAKLVLAAPLSAMIDDVEVDTLRTLIGCSRSAWRVSQSGPRTAFFAGWRSIRPRDSSRRPAPPRCASTRAGSGSRPSASVRTRSSRYPTKARHSRLARLEPAPGRTSQHRSAALDLVTTPVPVPAEDQLQIGSACVELGARVIPRLVTARHGGENELHGVAEVGSRQPEPR
jgi:hypothetical protein